MQKASISAGSDGEARATKRVLINLQDVPQIPAKPDRGSRAKAEFCDNLVPGMEDLAKSNRIESFCFVVED